ncbi:hypothetical protein Bbelb_279590 [Branchiostoma belcheri]|nr:hypothetical protein Bbelb_279590 [Branchiostoma belcheri]
MDLAGSWAGSQVTNTVWALTPRGTWGMDLAGSWAGSQVTNTVWAPTPRGTWGMDWAGSWAGSQVTNTVWAPTPRGTWGMDWAGSWAGSQVTNTVWAPTPRGTWGMDWAGSWAGSQVTNTVWALTPRGTWGMDLAGSWAGSQVTNTVWAPTPRGTWGMDWAGSWAGSQVTNTVWAPTPRGTWGMDWAGSWAGSQVTNTVWALTPRGTWGMDWAGSWAGSQVTNTVWAPTPRGTWGMDWAGSWAGSQVTTRLDPAEPLFEHTDPLVRIDPTDAAFVDIIHTDGSSILTLGLGLDQPVGDVDFYPEGGARQPGCGAESIISKIGVIAEGLVTDGVKAAKNAFSCSHTRAIELFTESINSPCEFTAYPCSSWDDYEAGECTDCDGSCSVMGFHADKHGGAGLLYLNTNDKDPFCLTDVALRNRSRYCVQSLTRQNQTVIERCVSTMESVFLNFTTNMKDNVAEEIFCSEYELFLKCVTAVLDTVQPCKDTAVKTVIGSAYTNYSLTANYECDDRHKSYRGGQPSVLGQTYLSMWINMAAVLLCFFLVTRQSR